MPKKSDKNSLVVNNSLDERKQTILFTIIKVYLETGEPVGSRTISKKLDTSLSSATIRNEMSDLEELGYILKPHKSAGRVPSDKGYRLYVDSIIKEKEIEITTLKAEMNARVDKLEDTLKTVVKAISSNTNYAAMIAGPSMNTTKIKYTQLSNLDDNNVLVVLVAEGNVVKTSIVALDDVLDAKDLIDVSMAINKLLSGTLISECTYERLKPEVNKINKNKKDIEQILKSLEKVLNETEAIDNIWTYGSNNFFKYKEFTEGKEAPVLVEAFENKSELKKLFDNVESEHGLSVYIGEESKVNAMKNCSVITANCDFGNGMKGTIGVVGPKRMDYEKVLKIIQNTMQNINKGLSE